MASKKQQSTATAGIGDIISTLEVWRDARSNLRGLKKEIEIAKIRNGDSAAVGVALQGIQDFLDLTTVNEGPKT